MLTTGSDPHEMSTTDSMEQVFSTWIRVLLIVVGIQGITPDLNDLASPRAFRFFLPPLRTSNLGPEEEDSWHGEVSRPARSEQDSVARQRVERTHEAEFVSVGSIPHADTSRSISCAAPPASLMDNDRRIHLLCHLTC